jgi:hypothetical protein
MRQKGNNNRQQFVPIFVNLPEVLYVYGEEGPKGGRACNTG